MSKYRSTKSGTVNVRKGKELEWVLFNSIPDQRYELKEGEECQIWLAEMVGRGAWGTWHGITGNHVAQVIRTTDKTITFEVFVEEDKSVIRQFKKVSFHLFRCLRLVNTHKMSPEEKQQMLDKLSEWDA